MNNQEKLEVLMKLAKETHQRIKYSTFNKAMRCRMFGFDEISKEEAMESLRYLIILLEKEMKATNMSVKEALFLDSEAYSEFDGDIAYATENDDDLYDLFFKKGFMPPYQSFHNLMLEEVQQQVDDSKFAGQPWQPGNPE